MWFQTDDGLDYDVLHVREEFVHVTALVLLQLLEVVFKGPFTRTVIFRAILVRFVEVIAQFVDGVVGQVHKFVVHIFGAEFVRGEPYQAVVLQLNLDRVKTCDYDIQSDVLLKPVDQVWVHDLPRD